MYIYINVTYPCMHAYDTFDAHDCTRQYVQRVHLDSTGNRASVRVRIRIWITMCVFCAMIITENHTTTKNNYHNR